MATTPHWAGSVLSCGNGGNAAGDAKLDIEIYSGIQPLLADPSRYIVDVSMRDVTKG
jgi:hypothetical protein